MAEAADLSEQTIRVRKCYYNDRSTNQRCGLLTIGSCSAEFIRDNETTIVSVSEHDSKLEWTFVFDSSLQKRSRHHKKLKIKTPCSSIPNLICVTVRLVVDVSGDETSPFMLKHFRRIDESYGNADLKEEKSESLPCAVQETNRRSQHLDVRPRLRSDIGVRNSDGSMFVFFERNSLLPAERSEKFHPTESPIHFQIYDGNSTTAADNKHLGDLELLRQSSSQCCWLSLDVREDGTVIGRAREGEKPPLSNQKGFRYVRAEVISSSDPFEDNCPQVDVDLQSSTVTLSVDEKNRVVVDSWKLTVSNVLDPKESHEFFIAAQLPKQTIQIPPGVLSSHLMYTLIVKGLLDIDADEYPGTAFKVVCQTKTGINNEPTEQVHLVREALNTVAVTIPRLQTTTVTYWRVTLKKLTNYKNLPHDTCPEMSFTTKRSGKVFSIPLSLQAGCTYRVTLEGYYDVCTCEFKAKKKKNPRCKVCQMKKSEHEGDHSVFEAHRIFRAEMLLSEIETLYEKALDCIDHDEAPSSAPCLWLYRTKPLEYFEEILANGGIMKTFEKDAGGDPTSPINHKLKGLAFTASVRRGSKTGDPIPMSPFGNTRLLVPAEELLEKAPNLYFADFYCFGKQLHHVMLVLTRRQSRAERFCATRIRRLNITDNPFLFRDRSGNIQVSTAKDLMVHVFYTDDLDIRGYELKKNITQVGTGSGDSTGGIPKNRSCTMCNLDHALTANIQRMF